MPCAPQVSISREHFGQLGLSAGKGPAFELSSTQMKRQFGRCWARSGLEIDRFIRSLLTQTGASSPSNDALQNNHSLPHASDIRLAVEVDGAMLLPQQLREVRRKGPLRHPHRLLSRHVETLQFGLVHGGEHPVPPAAVSWP